MMLKIIAEEQEALQQLDSKGQICISKAVT